MLLSTLYQQQRCNGDVSIVRNIRVLQGLLRIPQSQSAWHFVSLYQWSILMMAILSMIFVLLAIGQVASGAIPFQENEVRHC
jgi:hypothetical protein